MKRLIVNKYGGPEVLELEDFNNLEIKESKVRIKVKYIGVNFADSLIIKGRYQERPRLPFSPGLELSGELSDNEKEENLDNSNKNETLSDDNQESNPQELQQQKEEFEGFPLPVKY